MTDESTAAKDEIATVGVKLPAFWTEKPVLWFRQLEAQFELAKITTESTKFNYVLAALNKEDLNLVSDLLDKSSYVEIKKRLISCNRESESFCHRKLLSDLELGDKKPSSLLVEMRNLSAGKVPDDLLKTIWLQRLPPSIQQVLLISKDELSDLAERADSIAEVSSGPGVAAIREPSGASSSVEHRLTQLEQEMREIKADIRRNRSTGSRSRSPSKTRQRSCWYHRKYGSNAAKCVSPCSSASKN